MNKTIRLVAIGFSVAAALALGTPAQAATAGAAAVIGGGGISPALAPADLPQQRAFSFAGNATTLGVINGSAEVAGSHACSFSGTDLAGTIAEGAGFVNGGCGAGLDYSASLGVFVRVGGAVVVAFVDASAPPVNAAAGVCAFVPTAVPVSSYTLACGAVAAKAP